MEFVRRIGVYLGATLALSIVVLVTIAISPVLIVWNWVGEWRTGKKYEAQGYRRPTCGCVKCAQQSKGSPHAAGAATGHALAQRVSPAAYD